MKKQAESLYMRYTDIPLPQAVVFYCEQFGIQHIVISAGSRNAPLTNGFVENPYFKTYSVVDERAAAFFALGIAQQLGRPVAVVCTSGSALLNYYPAVAEAFYSEIPLVILSADRMPYSVNIGDGQTIQQEGVFGPHVLGEATLKPDVIHATAALMASNKQSYFKGKPTPKDIDALQQKHQAHNIAELQRVFSLACAANGPVHANIPMEEPLYGTTSTPIPFPKVIPAKESKSNVNLEEIQTIWKKAKRKMILLGTGKPNAALSGVLSNLLEDPTVVILSEKTSHFSHPKAIASIDCLMAPMEIEQHKNEEEFKPEVLLTVGGMIVSKKIKFFLRKHQPLHHFHIDTTKANDTFYCLTKHICAPADQVLNSLSGSDKNDGTYQSAVLNLYYRYLSKGATYINQIPFSDLYAFKTITNRLPKNSHLQIANSSPIRYLQLFDLPEGTEVYANRGTAGIDGSTSTAMGAAQINSKPLVFITGDLSFFYDINGLWHNYIPSHARILLINNQGGGIFRILPGEKDTTKYDTYFETIHTRHARHLSKNFGFSYKRVQTKWGLNRALGSFFNPSKKPKILEICTPRKINDTVLKDYFRSMTQQQ